MARSTLREALKRADVAGVGWPLPEDMNHRALQAALYASRRSKCGHRRIEGPDWAGVHRELKRKHVTLLILRAEYIAANPGGYSYSRFCELHRSFKKTLSVTMRQTHAAGERVFVDYAGDGVPVVIDRLTGEIRMAQIFVAVLGASASLSPRRLGRNRCPTGSTPMCAPSRRSAACPNSLCPTTPGPPSSRPASAIPRSTDLMPRWRAHYRTAMMPARPRKPRDKAKVEQAVLIVERWLLGRLTGTVRNLVFGAGCVITLERTARRT
jgi:transposase